MSQLLAVLQTAEDTMIVHPGEMWFPPFVFGIICLVLLAALVLVTFSFRNMAASHPENPTIYVYEPIGHPGQPVEAGSGAGATAVEAGTESELMKSARGDADNDLH